MEMGDGESGDVAAIAKILGFKNISVRKDYSARERILLITV